MRGIPMRCGACKSWIVWGIEERQAASLQRAIRREGTCASGQFALFDLSVCRQLAPETL